LQVQKKLESQPLIEECEAGSLLIKGLSSGYPSLSVSGRVATTLETDNEDGNNRLTFSVT
jgi:hypothetical protein